MIQARIQHHPSRADLIPPLLERLGLPAEVIGHSSDPPSPWGGYLACLADIPSAGHVLIVQDDVTPALNFASAVEAIAAANPDTPVCLFLGRLPRDASIRADRAAKAGLRYIDFPLRSFLPVVAVLWPVEKLRDFAAWAEEHPGLPGQRQPRSDDAMAGMWKMRTRQHVRACVPSIVQHPDEVPSTIGKQRQWGSQGRVAHLLADDAMAYDWSGD